MKNINGLFILTLAIFSGYIFVYSAEPANYYNSCENKGGANLLKALQSTVGNHTVVSYDGLWEVYNTSDVKANGKIWDMYSTKEWTPGKERCGNYKNVGDCINREHSMPKSWFNDAKPMYSDAFHLYPTDGKVNGQRSNYPYGECSKGTTLASNGSVKALGKLGSSTFAGYSGTVFEPDDQYKGDFARSYFYMAAAYNDKIAGWDSPMLAGNAYPAFSSWAVELLLKWHRQDPVSDKEIARNEAVYAYQKNRNPFIDHPEMVEYIWGDKKNETWSSSAGAQPTLVSPVNNSTIDLGTVAVGVERSYTINVKGTSLKSNVNVSLNDPYGVFSLSTTVLSASALNLSQGTNITIKVTAKTETTYIGTLNFSSADGISTKVTLTANALSGLPASAPTQISDCSFVAHWTYIGDADSNGCYQLYVLDSEDNYVDTYPRSVPATDEEYLVDELEPETDYRFYIRNSLLSSNIIEVRTAAPIPSVQILYDGELELVTEPGIPSEAVELLLDIENIYDDITFTVSEPFQLSSDKTNWSTSLTVDPREDRIYIRIFGEENGSFSSVIRATSGEYINDNAEVNGQIYSATSFIEDFDVEGKQTGNYTTKNYTGNAASWELSDAGVYQAKKEAFSDEYYLRLGKTATSSATMTSDKSGGIGTVTIMMAGWSKSDGSTKIALDYSSDGGQNWIDAGIAEIPTPESSTIVYNPYTFTVNCAGNVRLRIRQTYGQRACIDDISATNYYNTVEESLFGDDRGSGWDAYSLDGQLIVSIDQNAQVAVHGIDGITYFNDFLTAGTHSLSLHKGLYIVVVGNSTRRVLVK